MFICPNHLELEGTLSKLAWRKMAYRKKSPLVIKIGSAVLTNEKGQLDEKVIKNIVDDIAKLHQKNQKICIVSSGAIGAGMQILNKIRKPKQLKKKQALAAIGQIRLMNCYQGYMDKFNMQAGQILLSHEDFSHRETFLNTRGTIQQLLELGVIPIINENDSVSTEEIQFGDNDQLAILIANAIEAERVIFLSTIDGLMDFNKEKRELIPKVDAIDKNIFAMAKGGNHMGSGGMGSKLMALDSLNKAGKTAWLANGKKAGVIEKIATGKECGTLFKARTQKTNSKELWMRQHLRPHGTVSIDEGAYKALKGKKASLLTPGIQKAKGKWETGHLISVLFDNQEIARGMARMSDNELKSLIGKSSSQAQASLNGEKPHYLIHRNDIAFIET